MNVVTRFGGWSSVIVASLVGGAQAATISVTAPSDGNPVAIVSLMGQMTVADIDEFRR
jgi:hypothetical protein